MLNLKSKIAQKVLSYYFVNSGAKKYVNELAKILDADPGNLDRKLKEFESEGVLASEFSGNQRYYFLNRKCPFLKELKKIHETKFGLGELLREKLRKIEGIKEAYIFGSYAGGKLSAESDIDLLFIGSHSALEAQRAVLPLQKRFQREFNIIDMTEKELVQKKKLADGFITNIFKNKTLKIL